MQLTCRLRGSAVLHFLVPWYGSYSQFRRHECWFGHGIRFGIALWAVGMVPLDLTNCTIEPWPGLFVVKILAWELLAVVVAGVLAAALAKGDLTTGRKA